MMRKFVENFEYILIFCWLYIRILFAVVDPIQVELYGTTKAGINQLLNNVFKTLFYLRKNLWLNSQYIFSLDSGIWHFINSIGTNFWENETDGFYSASYERGSPFYAALSHQRKIPCDRCPRNN